MSKPQANLQAALQRKKSQPPKAGGVESTFRTSSEATVPSKKTTWRIPESLHRELRLHSVNADEPMGDLVVRYIEQGLKADQQDS